MHAHTHTYAHTDVYMHAHTRTWTQTHWHIQTQTDTHRVSNTVLPIQNTLLWHHLSISINFSTKIWQWCIKAKDQWPTKHLCFHTSTSINAYQQVFPHISRCQGLLMISERWSNNLTYSVVWMADTALDTLPLYITHGHTDPVVTSTLQYSGCTLLYTLNTKIW